jgi:hypothetical protein
LNWSIPVSTSASRYPERCILSTSSFNSSIISFIIVQSFLFFNRETIASLRVGSLSATYIEQMGVYNGCMERVSISISKRYRKQKIGQKKRDRAEMKEERQEGAAYYSDVKSRLGATLACVRRTGAWIAQPQSFAIIRKSLLAFNLLTTGTENLDIEQRLLSPQHLYHNRHELLLEPGINELLRHAFHNYPSIPVDSDQAHPG